MIKRFKVIYPDKKEFENILSEIRKNRIIIKEKCLNYDDLTDFNAYLDIERTITTIWIKNRKDYHRYKYIFRLDGEEPQKIEGLEAYKTLKQYCPQLPDLTKDPYYGYKEDGDLYSWNFDAPCAGIIGFNEKYNNHRYNNCVGYDINSAFAFAMLKDMPDTSNHPREFDKVKKNEIGFDYDKDGNFKCYFEGHFCRYVFPLIKSPFIHFVDVWFNRKKTATNKNDKLKAKAMLTHSVGFLQRRNPFIRCAIITYSNNYISSFIDEDTLYWNTDSIVSLKKRNDIEQNLGAEIGQWKIEHEGDFAYKGNNYQWNKGTPTIRGVPKSWFKDFDILTDKIPSYGNIYYIDEKFYLRRINERF